MPPKSLFRCVAVAEAVTWALLLLGMVLKYATHTTELGVRVFGMAHGVVFIAYCLTTVFVAVNQRWPMSTTAIALAAAVPPFVTVLLERRLERRDRLEGGWRLAPGGAQPSTLPERAQAWMLRRPSVALAVGLVGVAALTGLALLVGPPVPSSS